MYNNVVIKVAFFDINDTLINHSSAQESTIRKMSSFLPQRNIEEFATIWKKMAKEYWQLFEEGKLSFEDQRLQRIASIWNHFKVKLTTKQIKQYANYYTVYYERQLNVNPILKVILELLQMNNIPIGIISNGYGPLQRNRMKSVGIESYFDDKLILISEEIGVAKPDEKIFILAETIAKVSPESILFFGDDIINDIKPAEKRGWKVIQTESMFGKLH